MVRPSKNIQWWWSNSIKTIEKPLKSMMAWKKTLTIPSLWKIDHRCGLIVTLFFFIWIWKGGKRRRGATSWFLTMTASTEICTGAFSQLDLRRFNYVFYVCIHLYVITPHCYIHLIFLLKPSKALSCTWSVCTGTTGLWCWMWTKWLCRESKRVGRKWWRMWDHHHACPHTILYL